jgi:hypothetical protein
MTWEEISKKYDKEKRRIPLFEQASDLGKNWGNLIRSTDKLIWLFTISNRVKAGPVKSLNRVG